MALRVLLIHQNFPSQLITALEALERHANVELAGIGMNPYARQGLRYRQYSPVPTMPTGDIVIDDLASKATVAAGAAAAARALSYDGFVPDIIIAHPGWGEALYLKDLFPRAKLVCYCEYYYLRTGGEVDFDPEFPPASPEILHRMRARNAITLASLEDADVGVAPTLWQRSTFPAFLYDKISIIHEGVEISTEGNSQRLAQAEVRECNVVSFAARYLEPHRGFHTFMRAIPHILKQNAEAEIRIVGSDTGGYGAPPADGRTWREVMLDEVGSRIDPARVRFLGTLDRAHYLGLLSRTTVHTYLTYPFVLSWSALEAMALGCPMVVSDTAPIREFVKQGEGAEVVDFFNPIDTAGSICELLQTPKRRLELSTRAKKVFTMQRLSREHAREAWTELVLNLS